MQGLRLCTHPADGLDPLHVTGLSTTDADRCRLAFADDAETGGLLFGWIGNLRPPAPLPERREEATRLWWERRVVRLHYEVHCRDEVRIEVVVILSPCLLRLGRLGLGASSPGVFQFENTD